MAVAAHSLGGQVAELYKLYVMPAHRKRGLARSIFAAAISSLKRRGVTDLHLEITDESFPFWMHFLQKFDVEQVFGNKFLVHI